MTELLAAVGSMSLTAGLTALVVLVLRWALVRLRTPAFVRLLLWAVVLFRMVCPVSFTSPWGAAALVEEALPTEAQVQTTQGPVQQPGTAGVPAISPAEPLPEDAVVELTPMEPSEVPEPRLSPMLPLSLLWLAGVVVLWGWWLYTHRKLKKRMETAVRVAPGVLESDQSGPPFVLGFFPPKIYLPRGLEEPHRSYVLSHERFHLRRGDFLWKPLFFLAAAVHWFNPVLWLAADSTGGAGLPQSPPTVTLSLDHRQAELTAADWDGETPPDPAELLADAPLFTDDYIWSHNAGLSLSGQPRPTEGTYNDYLLREGQWVEGHSGSMTYTIALQPRADSAGKGTEERGGGLYLYLEGGLCHPLSYLCLPPPGALCAGGPGVGGTADGLRRHHPAGL